MRGVEHREPLRVGPQQQPPRGGFFVFELLDLPKLRGDDPINAVRLSFDAAAQLRLVFRNVGAVGDVKPR